ncbi:MAG: hypothetical protein HY907_10075 [Deltaproteobacteria bacterium]|nr:hypothetical protein [Deltaproteobacteria bacterium]
MGNRKGAVCLALATTGLLAPAAHAARETAPAVLPLRSVVLYESGVGYFERRGPVQRHGPLALLVPQNHLDDALMTLVVLTSDGARVGAMTFPSVLAPEAALAESPAPFDAFAAEGSILPLLGAMAGLQAKLVTRDGETLEGRVIGVARVEEPAAAGSDGTDASGNPVPDAATVQLPVVVFLAGDGALRWFKLDEIESVGPADEPAQTALDRAVAALAQRRGEEQETVGVSVREGGDLAIGYLAEAPVWRVSYRLVFQDARARVQGWALVHNDTDEDWQNVAVELVEGQPNSYLFPFVTPRFRHREVVPAEDGMDTAPQLAGTNADQLADAGLYGYGYGYGSGGGYGSAYGSAGMGMIGTGYGGGGGVSASQLLAIGELAAEAQASPEQRRELLSYHATEPLSLRAHESALVPVIDAGVSAERISLVDDALNVLAAIKIRNDTGFALREGPLAVFDGGFSGQSWLPRMYVEDARVLPHGADLDVVVEQGDWEDEEQPRIVRWFHPPATDWSGAEPRLEEHYVHVVRRSYVLTSHAASERNVCLRAPALVNGRVTSGGSVELLTAEDGFEYYHVCVELPAGEELTQVVATEEGLQRNWPASTLGVSTVAALAEDDRLPPGVREILRRAGEALHESDVLAGDASERQNAMTTVSNELARHRADLAALAGSGADEDVATEVAERMIEAGRRLDALTVEIDDLRKRAAAARERAAEILAELSE